MKIEVFRVSLAEREKGVDELNHFLVSHIILSVKSEMVMRDTFPAWEFCVTYDEQQSADSSRSKLQEDRQDYKEKLSPEAFRLFANMRKARKQICAELGEPPFNMFSNKDLEVIAVSGGVTPESVREAIGSNRFKKWSPKYAETFFKVYAELLAEYDARHQEESPAEPAPAEKETTSSEEIGKMPF